MLNSVIHANSHQWLSSCDDGVFDAIITDPPYGVTKDSDDYVAVDWLKDAYRVLKPDAALLMCVGQLTLREFWSTAEDVGFEWLNTIVWWHRNSLSRQKRRFSVQYDPILYFSKGNFVHKLDNVRIPYRSAERLKYPCNNKKAKGWMPNPLGAMCPDVWEIPAVTTTAPNGNDVPVGHKWQKPLSLMTRMIKCCCSSGDIILDPFCGSGTSLLAARDLGVNYVGIDIELKNVELSKSRLENKNKTYKENKKMKDIFGD